MTSRSDLSAYPMAALRARAGTIIDANETADELLGRPAGAIRAVLPGLPADDPVPVGDYDWWLSGVCYSALALIPENDGSQVLLVRDITEDRRAHSIVNRIADSVMLVTTEGQLIWRSEAASFWTPVPDDEVLGTSHLSRLHPEDITEALHLLAEVVESPGSRAEVTARSETVGQPGVWEHVTLRAISGLDDPALDGIIVDAVIREGGLQAGPLSRAVGVSLADAAPIGIVICTRSGETVYGNGAARDLLGPDFDPLLGGSWVDHVDESAREIAQSALDDAIKGDIPEPFVVPLSTSGEPVWVRVLVRSETGSGGVQSVICTLEDITAEIVARAQAQRLESLLDETEDLVGSFDPEGALLWANRALRQLLARADRPLAHHIATILGPRAEDIIAEATLALTHERRWTAEITLDLWEGEPRVMSVTGVADESSTGEHSSLVVARDITRLKNIEAELRRQATHDSLTGLANQLLFTAELNKALARRDHSRTVAVLYADLDGFKRINDRFGHSSGDWFLQLVGERFKAACRGEDLPARMGGDEFAVLVLDQPRSAVTDLAARLHDVVEQPIDWLPGVDVSVSIGVAYQDGAGGHSEADLLIQEADEAMYVAKRSDGGVHLASPTIQT